MTDKASSVPRARSVAGFAGWVCLLGLSLYPLAAQAIVEGTTPTRVANFRLFGSHSATGAAVMIPGPFLKEINSVLLPQASQVIDDMPFDHRVEAAYLFWSGATPRSNRTGSPDGPDFDVDFTTADGTFYNDLSALDDPTGFGRCLETSQFGGFYYCRRDVTSLVANQGIGNANGTYTVGDLESDPGTLNGNDGQAVFAQAKYAGWSLLVVWSSETEQIRRDVVLYDGFVRLDERNDSAGQVSFSIGDFNVGSPALGRLSLFALEGDSQLGVPPQDLTGCPTCFDYIEFSAGTNPAIKLSNGRNPENNSFNSSWDGQSGIDIDTYDLFGLIDTGDDRADLTVSSGDGVFPLGDGESFFLGWAIMSIDTLTPRFRSAATKKEATPASASAGERVFYTLDVVNDGSDSATGVVLTDPIPAGTIYVAGSTRVDGTPVPDASAGSPLEAGLPLGEIPAAASGDNSRQVTFQVRVEPSACGGSISNTAVLSANEISDVALGPVSTAVQEIFLEAPTLTVSPVTAPPVGPGSIVRYRFDFPNATGSDIGGVALEFDIPAYLDVDASGIFASSGDVSLSGGGLTVENFEVESDGSAQISVIARVFTESELNAAGVADDAIDGLVIGAQGLASGGCGAPELSDDPAVVGEGQPTELVLFYRPEFAASVKEVADQNGSPLEPNDVVSYRITLENSGNRPALVELEDPIPAFTRYVPGSTQVDGAPRSDVNGAFPFATPASAGTIPAGGSREVVFEVRVEANAPNGSEVTNVAEARVPALPEANVTLVSPTLRVFAAPELDTSRKTVVDLTAPIGTYEPGDEVEYELVVENTGNRPATSLTVEDPLPAELVFLAASAGGSESGGTVSWTLGSLPPGESRTLSVTARLRTPLPNGAVVINRATLSSTELDPLELEAAFTVESAPVLSFTKVVELSQSPAEPGDRVTYRLRVQNDGNAVARDLRIIDPIDSSLVNVIAPTGTVSAGTVEVDSSTDARLAALGVGASEAIELIIEADVRSPIVDGTVVSNQATLSGIGFGPVDSDDPSVAGSSDPTVFVVRSDVALTLTKVVRDLSPSTPLGPGDRVRYTLGVTVGGTSPISELALVDPLPPQLRDPSATGGTVTGSEVRFPLGTLNPGERAELTIDASIREVTADGTVVSNQARAEAPALSAPVLSDGDENAPGAQTTDFTVVAESVAAASLRVERIADENDAYNPGDRVRYTAVIENRGNVGASGVELLLPVPGELALVDAGGGTLGPSGLSFSSAEVPELATVAPGESATLVFEAEIVEPLDNGTRVAVQGTVNGFSSATQTDDPETAALLDPTEFEVESAPILGGFTKAVEDLSGDPLVTLPGDTLRYTLVLENAGDAIARDVRVRDPIDAALTVSVPGNASFDGATLDWTSSTEPSLVALAPGERVELVFEGTVDPGASSGQRVSNQATLQAGGLSELSDDPLTPTENDATDVFIGGGVDLGASIKRVSNLRGDPITVAAPSDLVRYTLEITNRGTSDANQVVVTDPLPDALEPVSAPGATIAGQSITWNAGTQPALARIGPGETRTLSFEARVASSAPIGSTVLNQAEIEADELSGPLLTDANPATVAKEATALEIDGRAALAGSTKVFVDPVSGAILREAAPGAEIRVRIALRNTGDSVADGITVEDVLDLAKLTTIVPRDGGTIRGDTVRWEGLALDPGVTRTLRVDARLREGLDNEPLSNQAFIGLNSAAPSLPTDDPSLPGDADPTILEILSPPDLTATIKEASVGAARVVSPGEEFEYRISIANDGSGTARGLSVTDVLAPEVDFIAVSDGGSYDAASRTVTVALPDLAPRSSRAVTLSVRVDSALSDGTLIVNQATVSAQNAPDELTDDPLADAPDAPTELRVISGPRLALDKSVTPTSPNRYQRPGDELTYRLVLSNRGNAAATNVEILDSLDLSALEAVALLSPGELDGASLRFSSATSPELASLAPEESFEAIFTARIVGSVRNGAVVANQASVSAVQLDESVVSDDPATTELADATEVTVEFPELVLTKELETALPVQPGDPVRYTLVLENRGTVPALNVRVEDPIPEALGDALGDPAGSVDAGRYLWSSADVPALASLAAGERVTLLLDARVDESAAEGTSVSNQAAAAADDVESVLSDWPSTDVPLDATTFEVSSVPTLVAAKVVLDDDDRVVSPGQELSYGFEVLNQGTSVARAVSLRDTLPESLEVVDAGEGTVTDERDVRWDLGDLAPGSSVAVQLRVRVALGLTNGFQIENQGEISATGLPNVIPTDDPNASGDADPTVVSVSAQPALNGTVLFAEDTNGGALQPGDRIRYTLRVVNVGTFEATQTRASLPLPPFTRYIANSTTLNGAAVPDLTEGPLVGNSPIFDSMTTVSRRPGTPPGVVWPTSGQEPTDEESVVRFDARVDPRALPGTVIETQAVIRSEGGGPVASDDCTRSQGLQCDADSVIGEPTVLVVGGGAAFTVAKTWSIAEDVLGNGRADPGDTIRYRVQTTNLGSTASAPVTLTDVLAAEAAFVPQSMRLGSEALSDAADDDAGRVDGNTLVVTLGALAPGEQRDLVFDVVAGNAAVLVNQATLNGDGTYLSDGDPSIPGAQPTRIVLDPEARLVAAYLSASDRNGGVVQPGDPIRYALTVVNEGGEDLERMEVRLGREPVFAEGTPSTPEGAELESDAPSWRARLPAGARREFVFDAALLPSVSMGRAVTARGVLPELELETDPVELVVGGGAGSSTLEGRVFLDRGEKNGVFDVGEDEPLEGFTVALIPEGAEGSARTRANLELAELAVRTVRTAADGRYRTGAVPPGSYRVVAATPNGAVFGELPDPVRVSAGLVQVPELAIDPSGIVYEVEEGIARPVAGARVFLVDEQTGLDLDPALVAAGQQGQITTAQGFYRFDLRAAAVPGSFRLRVVPPGSQLFFPSGLRPPVGASADSPFGAPAPGGPVSPFPFPRPEEDASYYLRFELDADTEDVTNNHVPLDRLSEAIRVTKQVNRRRASVGDIVTYTVTVTNPLPVELTTEEVGARIYDLLPPGLQWANDSEARRTVVAEGRETTSEVLRVARRTSRSVELEPMPLPALSTTTVRYYAVVGLRAEGELTNRVELRNAGNAPISNRASVRLRVVDDPIFDEGTVLGRVFCDDDGDGVMHSTERGLPGARVFLDTGFYADTDLEGNFHFRGVRPGRHVIKADPNTMPPGSRATNDPVRDFILTRGLLAKIDFAVQCGWEPVAVRTTTTGVDPVTVVVDTALPAISIAGVPQDVLVADAVLASGPPDFGAATAIFEPNAPLRWHIRVPGRSDIARWSISVFDSLGEEHWRASGDGVPPRLLREVPTLDPDVPYVYRIALLTDGGEIAEGAWRRFMFHTASDDADATPPPLEPFTYPAFVSINGTPRIPANGRVETEVELGRDGRVRVDARQSNGRRVSVVAEPPYHEQDNGEGVATTLEIVGSLETSSLTINGQAADVSAFSSSCLANGGPHAVAEGVIEPPVRFELEGTAVPTWMVRVFNPDGTVLVDLSPDGGSAVSWAGRNRAGTPVAQAGRYTYRCLLSDEQGGQFVGPMLSLQLGTAKPSGEESTVYNHTFRGDEYPDEAALQASVREELARVAAALEANPEARVVLEVHDHASGGRVQAQMRTVRLAAALQDYFIESGVAKERVELAPLGANQPVMPGDSRIAEQQNRRVIVTVLAPSETEAAPDSTGEGEAPVGAALVRVAGRALTIAEDGSFAGSVTAEPDGVVAVELAGRDGRRLVTRVPLRGGVPEAASVRPVRAGAPEGPLLGSPPDAVRDPGGAATETGEVGLWVGAARVPLRVDRMEESPLPTIRLAQAAAPDAGTVSPDARPAPSDAGTVPRDTGSSDAGIVRPVERTTRARLRTTVPDAPLVVFLPPDGSELRGERLTVVGQAEVGLTVTVNGKAVRMGEDGRFSQTLVLPPGEAEVTVRAEGEGDALELRRRYRVPNHEWFLLAMADTAFGAGNPIVGMNDDTTLDLSDELGDELYLHGRAVAYLKGRVKGSALLASSPFEDLRVTAHVDTGKQEEPELLRQLINPDVYYPVYGDSVEEVQDVRSRERLYVLLEADRSKFQLGNFRAELNGAQLFQYQRTFFGANLDVDHEFVDGARTQVKAFAADGGAGTRHRQVVFQGTGGAMYFLRDDAIIEGSERVQLVIRDAVSGARLMVVPQVRDVDYTMQYRDGRLMFMQPIPSTVTAGWNINQNPVRTLDGHRVFLEVEYDYEAVVGQDNEDAYAFQLRQSFADRFTVGGGIVQEERDGSQYRLIGGEASALLLPNTEIRAEVAFSEAVDVDTLASFDGGVTFGRIGSPDDVLSNDGAEPIEGWAAMVSLRGDGEDFFAPQDEPRTLRFPYELTFQHQEPGFYSGTNVLEQGQTKFGLRSSALLNERDSVRFRHDGIWSTVYTGESSQELNRQITALGYERKGEGWSAGAELGHTLSIANGDNPVQRATSNVFGRYQLTPRFTLLGEQEVSQEFGVDDSTIPADARLQGTLDSFATTVGAEYRLSDELSITALETLRWSGTNSAQIGLRARLMEDVDIYTSERFTSGAGRTVSTLIVGAESRTIPGSRSYGEYQLDHLASGRSGRAVFGMENAWTVTEGLKLQLSYERAQLVASDAPVSPSFAGNSITEPGVTGVGSGALSRDQQFSASSYAGGGVFPTGVASRDAFAIGAELLPYRDLKAGARFEMRYDRGDERLDTPDRLTVFGHLGGDYRFYDDLVALARVRGAAVRRTDVDFDEGQFLDVSLGVALRPRRSNAYGGLMKWTRRYERQAVGDGLRQFQLEIADVLSIEPWLELPWGFQLVGKGAVKNSTVVDADLPTVTSTVILGLGRLNYHLSSLFDTGIEYRWRANLLTEEREHGALVEFAWLPVEYASVGVGYNFTRFSDDLLAPSLDDHGFFLRVTGRF